ncbi:protein TOPLESS-RELATED PROTEIN 2-like isoform X1 [Camellia sinensis]|uniref:protein TOPLESS-RELATED PROTEIN 2-like isoform X1 n=1 Tax=Camellia sinensis TaxID=4442 RepID=UPI001035643D|nr:protein TOPLESS-RELATED PROTEIN 2-like isoform X1 [Camellia sinensis]
MYAIYNHYAIHTYRVFSHKIPPLLSLSMKISRFGKSFIRKVKKCFTGCYKPVNGGDGVKSVNGGDVVKSVNDCNTYYSDMTAEQRNKMLTAAIRYCDCNCKEANIDEVEAAPEDEAQKVEEFNAMERTDFQLSGQIMTTFMPPPPAATCLAFDPHDNNFCAVGMEDSTIQTYSVRVDEVKAKLKGHQKQITGLAFSQTLDILVSAGADAQLCIWDTEGWEKKKARPIQAPPGHPSPLVGETKVQFHNDQTHLLVVHESQIAVYDSQLGCLQSVVQLLYTNSGVALLALASDTMHKLWKWQRTEHNPSGKSSASIKPELWQPATKNDSYLLSASGGKVSLFNMITFKIMTTFMPPPPAATCLAFDPHDNNFCAVGMEDSTTQIYSVRVDEWYPRDSLSAPISTAIYSCDGLVVFTGFLDGAIGVFDADNFRLRCWIAPSAYISSSPIASNKGSGFPVVIAAHPFEPNQIALGMSNGAVHVIEPSDAEPECVGSRMVPEENGALPSVLSNSALSGQSSETPSG